MLIRVTARRLGLPHDKTISSSPGAFALDLRLEVQDVMSARNPDEISRLTTPGALIHLTDQATQAETTRQLEHWQARAMAAEAALRRANAPTPTLAPPNPPDAPSAPAAPEGTRFSLLEVD